jgi:biotin-(acetyl-CoA carboxylase) ligase
VSEDRQQLVMLEIQPPVGAFTEAVAPLLAFLNEVAEMAREAGCSVRLHVDGKPVEEAILQQITEHRAAALAEEDGEESS